jgi:tetratricopeptide (TPR) repeat protein
MHNTDVYGPCPCGSGAKYKFCCLPKERGQGGGGTTDFASPPSFEPSRKDHLADGRRILVGDLDEGMSLNRKGVEWMARDNFAKAIPIFRRAIRAAPFVHTAGNNLALCLFATGKIEEAIREQLAVNEESPLPNPFGHANLANFFYVNGDEGGYERHLAEALAMEMPSADACCKVCEALARTKRHRDILKLVDGGGFANDANLSLLAGIAAANLGQNARAKESLRKVDRNHPKAEVARTYLGHLNQGTAPATVRGDWPYLRVVDVCPLDLVMTEIEHSKQDWFARRVAVDCAEAMLNESIGWEDTMTLLSPATHPAATELLWALVKGDFGPDALRIRAAECLQRRGVLGPDQELEMQMRGVRGKVALRNSRLNPDFRFAGPLPEALEALYVETLEEAQRSRPKWEKVEANCRRILEEKPSFLPSRYNLAVSFVQRDRLQEGEAILRELVAANPEYLFARAALLEVLSVDGRIEEAKELVRTAPMLEETHPDAMVAWILAQAVFQRDIGDVEAALACMENAYQINPDHPTVRRLMGTRKG